MHRYEREARARLQLLGQLLDVRQPGDEDEHGAAPLVAAAGVGRLLRGEARHPRRQLELRGDDGGRDRVGRLVHLRATDRVAPLAQLARRAAQAVREAWHIGHLVEERDGDWVALLAHVQRRADLLGADSLREVVLVQLDHHRSTHQHDLQPRVATQQPARHQREQVGLDGSLVALVEHQELHAALPDSLGVIRGQARQV